MTVVEAGTWSITYDDKTWHESDATGEHVAFIVLLSGDDTWDHLDMHPAVGPGRLMFWITALVAVDRGVTDDVEMAELIQKVRETPIEQLMACITFH